MTLAEIEIVTFERLKEGKELLLIFPDGVIGCYAPSAESFLESLRFAMADALSSGAVLALVPIRLTAEEFGKLEETGELPH